MEKECINSLIEKECNYISKMIDRGAYSVKEIAEITNALAALVTASLKKDVNEFNELIEKKGLK